MVIQHLGKNPIQTNRDKSDVLRHIIKNVSKRLFRLVSSPGLLSPTGFFFSNWNRDFFSFWGVDWNLLYICLGRVLRWSRPINGPREDNGPREEGTAPVTRIHSWVSDQFGSFYFFFRPTAWIFPSLEIDPLHIFSSRTRRERRGAHRVKEQWEETKREQRCGKRKETIFCSHPAASPPTV